MKLFAVDEYRYGTCAIMSQYLVYPPAPANVPPEYVKNPLENSDLYGNSVSPNPGDVASAPA